MKDNSDFVRDFNESVLKLFNEGDFSLLDKARPDFRRHLPARPPIKGREGMIEHVNQLRTQFPDLTLTILESVYDGDRLVNRFRLEGTELGKTEVMPGPPSGRHIEFEGVSFCHLKDGKILDEYVYSNFMAAMQPQA